MKTIEEKMEIYRAYLEGKTIQFASSEDGFKTWEDTTRPSLDYDFNDYRIKPEPPKQRTAYAYVSVDGNVEWNISGRCSVGCTRAPEFDIVAELDY